MAATHVPSMEGFKMTLKKHQHHIVNALQHAESELESLASNAELPFTSLIKGSVLPSHSSKMKKIPPDQVRRRNFAAKLQEARQRQMGGQAKETSAEVSKPKEAKRAVPIAKKEEAAQQQRSDDENEDDDDLPEVQVIALDFTEDLFGAEKLGKDEIDWVYKEAAAGLLLPVAEDNFGKLGDEVREDILLDDCAILGQAFGREHAKLLDRAIASNDALLDRWGEFLMNLEAHSFFVRNDFPDADSYEAWKKLKREQIKKMISTLTQMPDYAGRLHIKVLEARDLPGSEGKVNASCRVQVSKKDKCKTSDVRSLSPTWNEEFTVELTQPFEAIEASVWNKVTLGANQCFGTALIPYQELHSQQPIEEWFPLHPEDKKAKTKRAGGGELKLALHLLYSKKPLQGSFRAYAHDPEWERWEKKRARDRDLLPLHYEGYMFLLRKLVQYENPGLVSTLSLTNFPLSEASSWLLEEFAQRHLIPAFYTKLAYLCVITKAFEVRKDYLAHVIATLRSLVELQKSSEWKTTTTYERDLFYTTLKDLREEIRQVLMQYHRKLNNFVLWAEEEAKKSAKAHISPAQLERKQVEDAVEMLTDILTTLLDLLTNIPKIPDKYLTKPDQSDDFEAITPGRRAATLKQEVAEWIEAGINVRFGKFQARLLRVSEIKNKPRKTSKKGGGAEDEDDEESNGETKEGVIADICDHIVSSLNKDKLYYQKPFLQLAGVDVVERGLFLYYPHIKAAVTEWLTGGTEDPPLTDRTFDVFFALRKLHELLAQYSSRKESQHLDINKLFLPFVDKYLVQCHQKLKEWAQTAFNNDDWKPIDSEEEDDELRILHSASVVSLFSAMRQAVQFIFLLDLNLFPTLLQFTKIMGEVIDYYLAKLEKSVASTVLAPEAAAEEDAKADEALDKRQAVASPRKSVKGVLPIGKIAGKLSGKAFGADDVNKLPTTVTQDLCIKINNVETIVKQLAGMKKDLYAKLTTKEDKAELNRIFSGIFSAVELRYNQIIAIITSHMNDSIKQVIFYLLDGDAEDAKKIKEHERNIRKSSREKKSIADQTSEPSEYAFVVTLLSLMRLMLSLAEERVEYFFQFLNSDVGVLSDHLYFDAFSILLAHVWTVIIKDFEEILLPVSPENDRYGPRNRPKIAKMLDFILTQRLFEFFEADGDGLEREYIDTSTVLLRRAIALYDHDTSDLKVIYRAIEKKHDSVAEQDKGEKGDPLEEWHILCILETRPNDKEAQEFVTAKRASARNQTIRRYFKLSKQEQLIAEFECNNAEKIRGRLYLSTSSVCWEPVVDARKLLIPIKQITFVARNKHVSFPDAIQITADKEDYAFWNFGAGRSEEFYEMLLAQARLLGNTAIVPFEEISSDEVSRIQMAQHSALSPRSHAPSAPASRHTRSKSINQSKNQTEKEEELLALFSLPDDEVLVQQYACVMKSKLLSGPGRLIIFRAHFCFLPSVGATNLKIAISEIKSIKKKRTAVLLPNALSLSTSRGDKFSFHSMLKRNEAYSIMREQIEQVAEETRRKRRK